MSENWITADPHLGHYNIIRLCNRPFWKTITNEDDELELVPDLDAMEDTIIGNINDVVAPNDTLRILGDMTYRGKSANYYREKINCRNVHLILGNHDDHQVGKYKGFASISYYQELHIIKKIIVLFHYPMRSWRNSNYGSIHLFGHVHGNMQGIGRSMDVGVDCHDYRPLLLTDIIEKMESVPLHKDFKND